MKSKSFVLMILSLGFGLIAAIGISQVMRANKASSQPVQKMGPVLVAADFLDMKSDLTEENVKIENWPSAIIPEDAATSIEDIKDMAIMVRMSKGMPVVKSDLIHKNNKSVIQIPEGYKVVAIKVSGDGMIGGLLNPGDNVDVIGLFKKQASDGRQQTISRTFLKALRVFSVNNKLSAVADRQEGSSTGNAIVGVLVTEKQAEEIFYVQKTGEIKLVLRGESNAGDEDVEDLADIMRLEEDEVAAGPAAGNNAANSAGSMVSGLFQQYAMAAAGTPAPPESVIVWKGGEAQKFILSSGEVPQRVGMGNEAYINAPAAQQSAPPKEVLVVNPADEEESAGDEEVNRSTDEDQYRSE